MTENKDKQPAAEEKAKERNWISASLWADKEDIRKGAERYGEVKWYKSARFWPSMLVLILTWIFGERIFQYPPASILTMPPVWMTSQWMMDRYHKWLDLIKEQEKGNDKNEEE